MIAPPTYRTQYYSIFLNRKLLWCPVYKAASSTWMNIIPRLTNYKFSQIKMMEQIHIQANDLIKAILPPLNYVKLDQFLVNELPVKFLIVRHPFHRLLSAYIDKFEVCATFIQYLF